jgi:hypothetical protein
MSAPQRQVLESVQQAANYFAYLMGRGSTPIRSRRRTSA